MISRDNLIQGPALVTFDSDQMYTEGDIQTDFNLETFERRTAIYGKVDEQISDRSAKVSFVPMEITEANLTKLWPYASTPMGTKLFTGTDKPLEIWTTSGKKVTFAAAALTKCPNLILSAEKHILGQAEYTCLGANNTAWSTASSLVAVSSVSWVDPASLALASVLQGTWSGSWAASGAWSAFTTENGFEIEFDVQTQPIKIDSDGTLTLVLTGFEVRAKCTPITTAAASEIGESELISALQMQGSGSGRGKSMYNLASTYDLTITNDASAAQTPKQKLTVVLKKAAVKTAGMRFGHSVLRPGEVGWVANRTLSGSAITALYTMALS